MPDLIIPNGESKSRQTPVLNSTPEITPWNNVRSQIIQITNTDVALLTKEDAAVMGKANYSLEAVQKWARDSKQSLETQNEIAIYRLWLNRKQGEWINENIPEEGGGDHRLNLVGDIPTLSQVGIDRNDSPKFRIIAKLPIEKIQKYIEQIKANAEITTAAIYNLCKSNGAHVSNNSGEFEWYTPPEYIQAARATMGSIDLDPASSDKANEIVKATYYYTRDDDGRIQLWQGNVWMNPPYSQPLIAEFCDLLVINIINKKILQACVLTNNATETSFYQNMLNHCTSVCFIKGRVKFIDKDGNASGAPLQGQTILYFGNKQEVFKSNFARFGVILHA